MSTTIARASTIIENNWDAVKTEMRNTWRKLSTEDVEGINNHRDLIAKLQETYSIAEEEAAEKIDSFIDKLKLEANLTRLQEIKETLYESASDAKEKISHGVKSSLNAIQEKTGDIQEDATKFAKENPLKILGLTVLAAFAIKELFKRK
jgi:hypothetical protein